MEQAEVIVYHPDLHPAEPGSSLPPSAHRHRNVSVRHATKQQQQQQQPNTTQHNTTTHPHRAHLGPVRPVGAAAAAGRLGSVRLCLAVPPLAGSSVWPVEEEEVQGGWWVGYAPTCVRLVNQCRRRQLDGAQRRRPAARCTRG